MKKICNLFVLAALAICFTACSDDDDPQPYVLPTEGVVTFDGTLTTTASGVPYASDNTSARLTLNGDGTARLVIDEMTARPATEKAPASVMTDFTIENVLVRSAGDGIYTITTENFSGGGTMNGRFSAFAQGDVHGAIVGDKLSVTVDYKFTQSPYEPQLSSTFEGVRQ